MRPSHDNQTFACAICGGPAQYQHVRGQQRLMCHTCGATHPAQAGTATPASRASISDASKASKATPALR